MANTLTNNIAPHSSSISGSGAVSPGFLLGLAAPTPFDHIKRGKVFNHFRYPSKIEGFIPFKDALCEVIPIKIKRITARMKKLEAERKKLLQDLAVTKDKWFVEMYADARFEEYTVCQKWLNYWLTLWDEINDVKKSAPRESFEKEKAREFPIENLYQGQLRSVSGRLQGLCPFHEERTPSFFIFPDNHYFCFGCSEHGDAIDFCMKLKGYDFKEAVRSLT